MEYDPRHYFHKPCSDSYPDSKPYAYAWPESHYKDNGKKDINKMMLEPPEFVYCQNCGEIMAIDDPMWPLVEKRYRRWVRIENRRRRIELASDSEYRKSFKSIDDMWINLKKLSVGGGLERRMF